MTIFALQGDKTSLIGYNELRKGGICRFFLLKKWFIRDFCLTLHPKI